MHQQRNFKYSLLKIKNALFYLFIYRLIYIIRPEVNKMKIIAKHIKEDETKQKSKSGPCLSCIPIKKKSKDKRTERRILFLPHKVYLSHNT
jgi:hypothetical protein